MKIRSFNCIITVLQYTIFWLLYADKVGIRTSSCNLSSLCIVIFPDQDNTPIVVGVTVPLVLLIVLAILVVVIRKRRFASRKATETRGNDNLSLPDSIIETR